MCTRKHITQALVLLCESEKEPILYGWHRYLACGHMAEAEDEVLCLYPKMARDIRDKRVAIDEDEVSLCDLAGWFEETVTKLSTFIADEDNNKKRKLKVAGLLRKKRG